MAIMKYIYKESPIGSAVFEILNEIETFVNPNYLYTCIVFKIYTDSNTKDKS